MFGVDCRPGAWYIPLNIGFWVLVAGAIVMLFVETNTRHYTPKNQIEIVLRAQQMAIQEQSAVAIVAKLRAIDVTNCPADFRVAFVEYLHAWDRVDAVEQKCVKVCAEYESDYFGKMLLPVLFGNMDLVNKEFADLEKEHQAAKFAVTSIFEKVELAAVAHGAKMPIRSQRSK